MQKYATRVFIYASILFGALGILMILTVPSQQGSQSSGFNIFITKFLVSTGFVVLSSFALSVAGKYLNGKS